MRSVECGVRSAEYYSLPTSSFTLYPSPFPLPTASLTLRGLLVKVKSMLLPEPLLLVLVIFLGLVAGSFANVCILRIPVEVSVIRPGSQCPACGVSILWRDNIPLLSFLLLRGRCRSCGARISPRYPLIEALTCLAFVGVYLRFDVSLPTVVYCLLALNLVIISGIDWDHLWIPRFLSTPGILVGPVLAFGVWRFGLPGEWLVDHPLGAVVGGCVGGGLIWIIRVVGGWWFKKEAMGLGDVDLMAFLGTFLGWNQVLPAIFLASLVGSVVGVSARILGRDVVRIPFGPYLALGAYICILYGRRLVEWYLQGLFFA